MENILNTIRYLFNFAISFITLDKPSNRLKTIFLGIFVLTVLPLEKIHLLPTFSVFSKLGVYDFLGFEFYSSGMTRALISLFDLNFKAAYDFNPLSFIFVLGLLIIILLDIFRFFYRDNSNRIFS